jgi:hypothetical protein
MMHRCLSEIALYAREQRLYIRLYTKEIKHKEKETFPVLQIRGKNYLLP